MPQRDEPSPAVLALATYVPMLLLALAINSFSGAGGLFTPMPAWQEARWQLAVAALIAAAIVLPGPAMSRRFAWAQRMEEEFRRVLGDLGSVEILILAVLSSVCEEALFRGALQPLLGIWGSAAVFALAHPPLRRDLRPWTLFAFVLGVMLGYLYAWEPRNLLAPIATHFLINFINLHRIARMPAPPDLTIDDFREGPATARSPS